VKSFNYWETLHRVGKLLCGQRCTREWFCSCDTAETSPAASVSPTVKRLEDLRLVNFPLSFSLSLIHVSSLILYVVFSLSFALSLSLSLFIYLSFSLYLNLFLTLQLRLTLCHHSLPLAQSHQDSLLSLSLFSLSLLPPPPLLSLCLS
jgi:hypothetical protein